MGFLMGFELRTVEAVVTTQSLLLATEAFIYEKISLVLC